MISKVASIVTISLALSAAPALAQDLIEWGTSDYWAVLIDPTLGNGCLIQGEYPDGSLVRIGLDRRDDTGYVTVFNSDWGDLVEGEIYPVGFSLDGEYFDGEAKGIYLNGVPGADVVFDNVDFFMSIATRQSMTLYNSDQAEVTTFDLTGTAAGLEAVLKCQDEQG